MGLSGYVGSGAVKGLEDLLTEQLLQAQQDERERAQRAQEDLQRERIENERQQLEETRAETKRTRERQEKADKNANAKALIENIDDTFDPSSPIDPEVSEEQEASVQGTPSADRVRAIPTLDARPMPGWEGTMDPTPGVGVRRLTPTTEQQRQRKISGVFKKLGPGLAGDADEIRNTRVKIWGETGVTAPDFGPTQDEEVERARRLANATRPTQDEEVERARRLANATRAPKEPKEPVETLTPEGLDLAANQYADTGTMPTLGMGSSELRALIINRAAALNPGLRIATSRSDFDANRGSLNSITKSLDAVTAYENTATQNLAIMKKAAESIPDSGSPLFNKPLRAINQQLLGSKELAAFNAARTVVIPEFARIISNPNLTGVLTNEQRSEVDKMLSGDMSMSQMLAVMDVLQRDANNRKKSLLVQRDAVRSRVNKTATSDSSDLSVTAPNGKTYSFKTAAEAAEFKRKAGIP